MKNIITGNVAIAKEIIESEVELVSGYPVTLSALLLILKRRTIL